MKRLLKSTVLALVLVSLFVVPAAAQTAPVAPPAGFENLDIADPGNGGDPIFTPIGPSGESLHGVVKLDRKTRDVQANFTVPAGNVFTAWVILCNDPDVFPCQDIGAYYGASALVEGNGRYAKWKFTISSVAESAGELHIINHGPDVRGDYPLQDDTPFGACLGGYGPNRCSVAFVDLP